VLDRLNQFERRGAVQFHRGAAAFAYSDGTAVERHLKAVLDSASDLSSYSIELEAGIQDWASEYHLSSVRANLLRGFDPVPGTRALELGCGCGAITRYLGEQGLTVDAVEGSAVRADLAARRCRGLDTVNVYCANFNDLALPEGAYGLICLVGVAEYAARFSGDTGDTPPVVALLERLRPALARDGVMLVAIENRTGMKYLLGAHEDHYAKRYVGINDYFGVQDINTWTLPEWEAVFRRLGITRKRVYLPFPDYKLPTVLLSRDFALASPQAFCNLEGVESRDYVDIFKPETSESLLWQGAAAAGALDRLANSFLFVLAAGEADVPGGYRLDFAHLPGFGRRREYCLRAVKPEGADVVRRARVTAVDQSDAGLTQRVIDEPYRQGTLLSVMLSRALEIDPGSERYAALVREYVDFVAARAAPSIDLTPANIVVDADGAFQAFDEEWITAEPVSTAFLLFRSLLVLVTSAGRSLRPYAVQHGLWTVRDFVVHTGELAGVGLAQTLDELIDREEDFQRRIAVRRDGNPTRELLARSVREDPRHVAPVKLRLYWRPRGGAYSEASSRAVLVANSDDRQSVEFSLPPDAGEAAWIRFNPGEAMRDDGTGFMRIERMSIDAVSLETGERDPVWKRDGADDIAARGTLSGIRFESTGLGRLFIITGDDPAIEQRFIPRRPLEAHEYPAVTIELSLPRSVEYLLARDRYAAAVERLEAEAADIDKLRARSRAMEDELAAIKGSRGWRLILRCRGVQARFDRAAAKARLWRALYHNLGARGAGARAAARAAGHLRRLTGREPAVAGPPTRYELWRDLHLPRGGGDVDGPLISVVMPVHNVGAAVLGKAVDSVRRQTYRNWELCIADDASTRDETVAALRDIAGDRIRVTTLAENRNISAATNAAVDLSRGEYLAFLDNDDELSRDALALVAAAIRETGADMLYTDEDFIRPDDHLDHPHFKPDYNPDLLLSHNYITHLLVMTRKLFEAAGRLRPACDGAQDYDLVLRAAEQARRIEHLARPLYHWRMSETSTSLNPTVKPGGHDNARRALEDALRRRGIDGRVEALRLPHYFRVRRRLAGAPAVTIVIPFRDKPGLLRQVITSILERSSYADFRILGISNDSRRSATFDEMHRLAGLDERIAFQELNRDFNFSALVNHGAAQAADGHVLLLNNDMEIITSDWIEGLLEHSQRPEVAAVGGKLYYPDNTIQHAGIAIGLGGYAGHLHQGLRADSPGYFNRLGVTQNVSAVTGAMMMVEKRKYAELGGFDESRFSIAYNDVDFCLRARQAGYLNVFTPFVEAYHHESASRGYEDTAQKSERFAQEKAKLLERHGAAIEKGDPYYNPNFDRGRDDFSLPAGPLAAGA